MKSLLPVFCAGLLLSCFLPEVGRGQVTSTRFVAEHKFELTGDDVEVLLLDVLLPKTEAGRQKVSTKYLPEPQAVFDKDGQRYAQFRFPELPAELTIDYEIEVERFDLSIARARAQRGKETPESLLQWMVYEKYLEKDAPFVQHIAKELRGDDQIAIVQACFDHVVKNMKRIGHTEKDIGGLKSLFTKEGDCTEFSDAFITLCRAKGIPARNCTGYLLGAVRDTPKHDWAEVYFEEYGWVPFDPHHAQVEATTKFDKLRPKYLAIERQRRNAVLNLYHFWAYNSVGKGEAKVKGTFTTVSQEAVK